MIRTVMMTLARQRLHSPMRMALAIACFGFGMIGVLLSGSLAGLNRSQMGGFGLIAAAGLIGQEVSSGVLTLAFARPIQRLQWVLGRWLGAGVFATGFVVLQVFVSIAVAAMRQGMPSISLVATTALDGTLAAFGACAVLLMFSSLVPGLGDLAVLLIATITAGILPLVARSYHLSWLARAGEELQRFLGATLDPAPLMSGGPVSWFAITSYLSTIAICVVVAVWAVNRKELSYASG